MEEKAKHEILELWENNKDNIPEGDYLKMCDILKRVKTKESSFYVELKIVYFRQRLEARTESNSVELYPDYRYVVSHRKIPEERFNILKERFEEQGFLNCDDFSTYLPGETVSVMIENQLKDEDDDEDDDEDKKNVKVRINGAFIVVKMTKLE